MFQKDLGFLEKSRWEKQATNLTYYDLNSVIVNSSQVRGTGLQSRLFVLPVLGVLRASAVLGLPPHGYWTSLNHPCSTGTRCVCVCGSTCSHTCVYLFWSLLKGSSRKIHIPSGRTAADIDLLEINKVWWAPQENLKILGIFFFIDYIL